MRIKPVLLILVFLFLFSTLSGCLSKDNPYEKIMIIDEINAPNGMYDPSLEYDENGIGWMAYSAVDAPEYVHTHLAKSTDNGKTWTYQLTINQAVNDTILVNNETEISGVWRHEVPTLVHDLADEGKEWKLYWHKYFTIPPYEAENRLFQYGWIAYKYSSHPGGPWSEEIALFGAGIFPPKPYETRIDLSSLHQKLSDFVVYSEPGSIIVDETIYLSMNAHEIRDEENIGHTILLSSTDHGETWSYVNTLLRPEDVKRFDGLYFSGSSLVRVQERIFLFACPDNPKDPIKTHNGTCIYEFDNIQKGLLKRDENGSLILHKHIPRTLLCGGQSDYDEQNSYGGIVMPQHNYRELPELFQLFNTKKSVI